MSEFKKFGQQLRDLMIGLTGLEPEGEQVPKDFEDSFFFGEINQFIGSGAELLVKGSNAGEVNRVEVGDRFIGIGLTHTVETLSRPAGPDTFRSVGATRDSQQPKAALRGFQISDIKQVADGFELGLSPLSPTDFSSLIESVSDSHVKISAATIPEGTMIISFLLSSPEYTVRDVPGSPGANWKSATQGVRHWNVGIGKADDFWSAKLPSDDITEITRVPSSFTVGTISFGLSLLGGSKTKTTFLPVPCINASGKTSLHQFCMFGRVVGTQGWNTPFPIGLRTRIVFHPQR